MRGPRWGRMGLAPGAGGSGRGEGRTWRPDGGRPFSKRETAALPAAALQRSDAGRGQRAGEGRGLGREGRGRFG